MGALAVLDYASRDAGIEGVVAISGGFQALGPERPANVLFLFARWDSRWVVRRAVQLTARLAGVSRVKAETTYGRHADGSAVRFEEIAGVFIDRNEPMAGLETSRLRSRLIHLELADWGAEGVFSLGFPMGPRIAAEKAADYARRLGVELVDRTREDGVR